MSVLRFDPARSFEGFARKMNNVFSEFDKGFSIEYGGFAPRADISEDENNVYFDFEIAGLKKEDVKITINEENILTIKGEKKRETGNDDKTEDKCLIRCERTFGQFTRSFMLPDNVKKDSVAAKYENGVLTLTLEKAQPTMPKEFEVPIG